MLLLDDYGWALRSAIDKKCCKYVKNIVNNEKINLLQN